MSQSENLTIGCEKFIPFQFWIFIKDEIYTFETHQLLSQSTKVRFEADVGGTSTNSYSGNAVSRYCVNARAADNWCYSSVSTEARNLTTSSC